MKIIKRNGSEATFDVSKIENAIRKANQSVKPEEQMNELDIKLVAKGVENRFEITGVTPTVEDVQEAVIFGINEKGKYVLALSYAEYRQKRNIARGTTKLDESILSLVEYDNEEVKQENSNKNPQINSTQRDYIAGEVSRDITKRLLLPEDIVKAWQEGEIHFHDSDYFVGHMHNCCLVNLDDMLQNGTVIGETKIEKPKSFATACNIATQIVASVASNQFGGQSVSLAHLAPFVQVSREKIKKQVIEERKECGDDLDPAKIEKIVNARLKREVRSGLQTIQYQRATC